MHYTVCRDLIIKNEVLLLNKKYFMREDTQISKEKKSLIDIFIIK